MIAKLHFKEFETLVDLIFGRGGWRRVSILGQQLPDVDLLLEQPTTGEIAWVQVKSRSNQAELDDYLGRFRRDGSCQRFYFVCHSPKGSMVIPTAPGLHLWAGVALADAAISAGLFDWLIDRTR